MYSLKDFQQNNIYDFEIPKALANKGISKITKEGNTILIKYNNDDIVRFQIFSDYEKTIKSFEKFTKGVIKDQEMKSLLLGFIAEKYNQLIKAKSVSKKEPIKIEKLDCTFEDWQKQLNEKYDTLRKTVIENFSDLWGTLEFTLSVKNILHIKKCTLPFGGIILGPPSSLKTLTLELLRNWRNVVYSDNFSAKAFVSHNMSVPKEQLEEIDLLPKIKNKVFLTPELAPLFSKKDDEVIEILGILTRVLDGHGYESDSGAHGHRGYNEDIMFVLIGAAVDIPKKIHKHLTNLGPKLYFFRISSTQRTEESLMKYIKQDNFSEKKKEVEDVLLDYLKYFEACPIMENLEGANLPKIEWNDKNETNDLDEIYLLIVRLGNLLSRLRGSVSTWNTYDTQGSDYGYSRPTIEDPKRAMTQLKNLAKGHALVNGRNYITKDDIPILIKTVLSTASIERVSIFDLLLNNGGNLTTGNIMEFLNISKPTALRTMTELTILGLVAKKEDSDEFEITLKDEFNWFLSEEFQKLRDGFIPQDHSEHLRKEKLPPSEQENSADEEIKNNEYHLSQYDNTEVKENLSNIEDKEKESDIIDNNTIFTCSRCDYKTTQNLELKLHLIEKHQSKLKELDSSLVNIENETQTKPENVRPVNDFDVAAA